MDVVLQRISGQDDFEGIARNSGTCVIEVKMNGISIGVAALGGNSDRRGRIEKIQCIEYKISRRLKGKTLLDFPVFRKGRIKNGDG